MLLELSLTKRISHMMLLTGSTALQGMHSHVSRSSTAKASSPLADTEYTDFIG